MRQILTLLIMGLCLALVISCGNQVPLTGGPKDELPPRLDTTQSTPNFQTQFIKQEVSLVFDEFVSLRNASKQILISPPPDNPPIINSRLKKVSVQFSEEEILKENATYVINFGSSIQDFNEGNKLENYTFVFSTGNYIDSLSIQGNVKDAFTDAPAEDVVVMLYVDHRDSILFLERPFYFARTDKEGNFSINNLRSDTFMIAVIEDLNLSYTYDPAAESVGFLDSLYILTDSSQQEINLQIFKEGRPGEYAGYDVLNQGKIQIEWEHEVAVESIRILDSLVYYFEPVKDQQLKSILWYRPRRKSRISWEHSRRGELDTTSARINLNNTDTLPGSLKIISEEHDKKIGLHPLDTLWLNLDMPAEYLDTSLMRQIVKSAPSDSLPGDTVALSWFLNPSSKMQIGTYYNWTPGTSLQVDFMPGAIVDFWNRNNDTLKYNFTIANIEDFGKLILKFEDFDSLSYFVELREKEKIIEQFSFRGKQASKTFGKLIPTTYSLVIIEDTNQNQKWDAGNYLERRQSEIIYRTTLEALRPDWTSEQTISLITIQNEASAPAEEETTPSDSRR